jgi:hypothetical protein
MDKAEADAELTRLERAERAHHCNQDALRYKITSAEQRIGALTALASEVDVAIARRRDTRGDAFVMTLDGITYSKRNRAGLQLLLVVGKEMAAVTRSGHPRSEARPGHLGGFDLTVTAQRIFGTTQVTLALDGAPDSGIRLTGKDLAETDATGLAL